MKRPELAAAALLNSEQGQSDPHPNIKKTQAKVIKVKAAVVLFSAGGWILVCIHSLKPGFEPDGQSDADEEADDVEESLVQSENDEGAETHGGLDED